MKKTSILQMLGVTREEIKIYETLLHQGPLSPTEICAQTSLYRPTTYEAIASLLEKDLLKIVPIGKRKKYIANSPKRLKEIASLYESKINEEIIRLEEIEQPKNIAPKVTMRYGKQGIRALYEELATELRKGDIYYRYHSIDTDSWKSGVYVTERARKLRDAKELERFVITNEANKKRKISRTTRYIKVLPKKHDLFAHNVGQVMYGNKTAIIDYNNETATVIESEAITAFHIALFKSLFSYI